VFYKRLIVLIRSIYAYATSMPTYSAFRRCKAKKLGSARMVCRITRDKLNPMDFGHCV
jgi:hypothetical protein